MATIIIDDIAANYGTEAEILAATDLLDGSLNWASDTNKFIVHDDGTFYELLASAPQDPVTLAGSLDYLTLSDQEITLHAIDLTTDVTGVLPMANGGTGANLSDPGADRVLFWDDSAGSTAWLALSGLTITGTTLAVDSINLASGVSGQLPLANGGTGANLSDPNADRILFWDDSAGAMTWLTAGTGLSISGTTLSATGSGGTVTSVGLSVPTWMGAASGSPVTTSGTLGVTSVQVSPHAFLAGPSAGASVDVPGWRTIVLADLPTIPGVCPTGSMIMWPTGTAPTGWLICDGSAVSRTTYADLFTLIGTTFGAGNGSTTFNLPDFRRRAPVGAGGTGSGTLGNAVGNTGGAETHTLTTSEMPSHSHLGRRSVTTFLAGGTTYGFPQRDDGGFTSDGATQSTGSGTPHNNMQPSLVVNFIIKT